MIPSQKQILKQLEVRSRPSALLRDLMRSLKIPKHKRQEFRLRLKEMVQDGVLVRIKGNRYGIPAKPNLVSGKLQGHPEGYGFVIPDEPKESDIFIPRRNMLDAMHGDRVVARVEKNRFPKKPARETTGGLRREGSVVRVLERGVQEVIGRFEWGREKEFGFVVPTDRRNWFDIYVPLDQVSNAKEGDLVLAGISSYPTLHRNPEGRIIRVFGTAYDPKIDTQMVMAEFDLPITFSEKTMAEARSVPDRVPPVMIQGLRDYRKLRTVTIDGENAKDFDDAVSIESLPRDQFRLWVHIADVSSYVPRGSELDLEARRRGTSVYFPDRVVPMFPERLSNGICSLKPGEERLAFTVEMRFDSGGKRVAYDLHESVIQSDARMTYTDVAGILEDEDPGKCRQYKDLVDDFRLMRKLAERLRQSRINEGSIDFDLPEPEIILDLQGKPLDIVRSERNIAHRLIEEFMLAANRTVAEHMSNRDVPSLYRIHETPEPEKIRDLSGFVASFGHILKLRSRGKDPSASLHPKVLQGLLTQVKGRPEERLINHVVLRSMKRARYSAENTGHFGLAAETYTHFTSPIRRYPDLVVHRLVKETLGKKSRKTRGKSESIEQLSEIAKSCSERERVATEAEREVVDLKKIRFMNDKMGEEFYGFITGVTAFGLFVELEAFFVEGLVHVTSIQDDYYIFLEKEHSLLGRHQRKRFRIADRVKVRVERVDLQKRQIDFTLVQEESVSRKGTRKKR